MGNDEITIYDMVMQMIKDDKFSAEQEDELGMMLTGRKEKREEERLSRCLYGNVLQEMDERVCSGEFKLSTVKRYGPIIKRCFSGKYGNMDASDLNQETLYEFITEVHEAYGMSRNEIFMFMALLKKALKRMGERGILGFEPSKNLFINHMEMISGTKLIDCPYTKKELGDISQWIMKHPSDIRGWACGLWLLGGDGLSPDKILHMKKQDVWKYGVDGLKERNADGTILDFDSDVKRAKARENVMRKAMTLHPEETEYVFMVAKKESEGWKKLSGPVLQVKMNWICNALNIPFKPFHGNEAITFNN